jgi:hypothetical protein
VTSSQAQDEASTAASYLGGTCLFRKLNTEKVTDSANSVSYKRQESSAYARSLERQGDQLFRQDTIESINEATQIYLLASEILGRRPAENPSRSSVTPATYREFEGQWDDFANKWEATTDLLPFSPWTQTYPLMLNAS